MPWIMAVNSILSLRIVQYLLVATLVMTLTCMGVLWFKNNTLKLQKAYYETEYAKVSAGLATQNEAVEQLGIKKAAQDKALEQALSEASKLAVVAAKRQQTIVKYTFTGDCDQRVSQSLELLRSTK
jgi:hypothetical protein